MVSCILLHCIVSYAFERSKNNKYKLYYKCLHY